MCIRDRILHHHLAHLTGEGKKGALRKTIGRGFAINQLASILFAAVYENDDSVKPYVEFVQRRRNALREHRAHIVDL